MQQNSGRASLSNYGRRRRCCREEGGARAYGCGHPSLPSLYIGTREGGGRSLAPSSKEGVRPRGGEESILHKAPRRCLPLFGLSPLQVSLAHGPIGAGALGPYGPMRTPYSPCSPPGQVDPRTPFGTPGTIPIKCETFPATKIRLPIYKSLPPYHSGTPHDVQDLIRDSEQYSVCCILIFIQP